MLCDFFRINMPYGMKRNENNEWIFFNREYMPLGYNTVIHPSVNDTKAYDHLPLFTKYKGLTEAKLLKLAYEPEALRRDEAGKINQVFFYNDRTNPQNDPKYWDMYFEKIRLLSKCDVAKTSTAY